MTCTSPSESRIVHFPLSPLSHFCPQLPGTGSARARRTSPPPRAPSASSPRALRLHRKLLQGSSGVRRRKAWPLSFTREPSCPETQSQQGDNPAGVASSLQRQSQPGQAAEATVTVFGGSRAPSRDIRVGKLVREPRALQKGTYFKQNIYNMIQR